MPRGEGFWSSMSLTSLRGFCALRSAVRTLKTGIKQRAAMPYAPLFELQSFEQRLFAGSLLSPGGEVANPVGGAKHPALVSPGEGRRQQGAAADMQRASAGALRSAIAGALPIALASRNGGGRV